MRVFRSRRQRASLRNCGVMSPSYLISGLSPSAGAMYLTAALRRPCLVLQFGDQCRIEVQVPGEFIEIAALGGMLRIDSRK